MLKQYSLKALEKAINYALSLDRESCIKLKDLEDKVIELIITPLNVHFFIQFKQLEMRLLSSYSEKPDTIIHSSPLGLIRLSFLPTSKARSLFNDKIRLSGDVELGQQVKQLFDELDIDWEGHLALFTGDVVAYQLGKIVKKGISLKNNLSNGFKNNLVDYIQTESRLLPAKEEVLDFFNDLDELQLDVERFEARLNKMLEAYEIN